MLGGLWTYPSFIGLAIVCGLAVNAARARAERIPVGRFMLLQTLVAAVAVLGAKGYAITERGGMLQIDAIEMIGGGYRYPGGLLCATVAAILSWRVLLPNTRLGSVLDVMAPSVGISFGLARLGCFFGGCCFGILSLLPWSVRFPRNSPAWTEHVSLRLIPPDAAASAWVHPLQLYMLITSLCAAAIAIWWDSRKAYAGETALVFLIVHESARALLEFLRAPVLGVWPWKLTAISAAIAGGALLAFLLGRMFKSRARPDAPRMRADPPHAPAVPHP